MHLKPKHLGSELPLLTFDESQYVKDPRDFKMFELNFAVSILHSLSTVPLKFAMTILIPTPLSRKKVRNQKLILQQFQKLHNSMNYKSLAVSDANYEKGGEKNKSNQTEVKMALFQGTW